MDEKILPDNDTTVFNEIIRLTNTIFPVGSTDRSAFLKLIKNILINMQNKRTALGDFFRETPNYTERDIICFAIQNGICEIDAHSWIVPQRILSTGETTVDPSMHDVEVDDLHVAESESAVTSDIRKSPTTTAISEHETETAALPIKTGETTVDPPTPDEKGDDLESAFTSEIRKSSTTTTTISEHEIGDIVKDIVTSALILPIDELSPDQLMPDLPISEGQRALNSESYSPNTTFTPETDQGSSLQENVTSGPLQDTGETPQTPPASDVGGDDLTIDNRESLSTCTDGIPVYPEFDTEEILSNPPVETLMSLTSGDEDTPPKKSSTSQLMTIRHPILSLPRVDKIPDIVELIESPEDSNGETSQTPGTSKKLASKTNGKSRKKSNKINKTLEKTPSSNKKGTRQSTSKSKVSATPRKAVSRQTPPTSPMRTRRNSSNPPRSVDTGSSETNNQSQEAKTPLAKPRNGNLGTFKCNVDKCLKRYKSEGALRDHMMEHSSLNLVCDQPGCKFKTKARTNLLTHQARRSCQNPALRRRYFSDSENDDAEKEEHAVENSNSEEDANEETPNRKRKRLGDNEETLDKEKVKTALKLLEVMGNFFKPKEDDSNQKRQRKSHKD